MTDAAAGRRLAPGAAGGAAVVVAAVLATWVGARGGSFQFDDWNVIVDEPRVASIAAWWASMPGIRPLLKLTYAAGRQAGLGYDGFLAVNVGIHAVAALLVLALLRRVATGARVPPPLDGAAPLLGALLFALHPVQTEAVTYASGRSASLSGALALASVVAWMEGRERDGSWLAAVASPALFALALATKESVVALPLALVVLLAVDVRRPFRAADALRATALHWGVLLAAAVAYAASPVYRRMLAASTSLRPPGEAILTHLDALAWLTAQAVRLDRPSADPLVAPLTRFGPGSLLEAGALVAAVVLGIAWARRRPAIAFGILWFLAWLPIAGFLLPRPDPANERQLYLSLAGPAWLAGLVLAPWATAGGARRAAVVLAVVALGAATVVRNRVYRDEVAFWRAAVSAAPRNARAHANLGFALAAGCRLPEAEAELRRALELDPGLVRAAVNLRLLREGVPLRPGLPPCPPAAAPSP